MVSEKEDPRLYFQEAINQALERLHLKIEDWIVFYLVELLARQAVQPVTLEPLVTQMDAALRASSAQEKFSRFKEMGDSALVLVGFYEEAVVKRSSKGYVVLMGGRAYRSAAALANDGFGKVYGSLSDGFEDFVQVLDEVKENTSLRTPQDIVKLYDKWRQTGSRAAASRLRSSGVLLSSKPGRN